MTSILIAYDSSEGQTRKIAQYLAERIGRSGHTAQTVDLRKMPPELSLEAFDAIILGASIHLGKHDRRPSDFVRRYKPELEARPSGFFSVSLSAAGSERERQQASRYVEEFLQKTGWQAKLKATLAGALRYREYGFLKRWMMKKIARSAGKDTDTSKNHEYTDWKAVDQFVDTFLALVGQDRAPGAR